MAVNISNKRLDIVHWRGFDSIILPKSIFLPTINLEPYFTLKTVGPPD